jgi:hypothetical protein
VKYRIVEEDRNTETWTRDEPLAMGNWHPEKSTYVWIVADSGQMINWRYVRRLVPIEEPRTAPSRKVIAQPFKPTSAVIAYQVPCPHCSELLRGIPWRNADWTTTCGHCGETVHIVVPGTPTEQAAPKDAPSNSSFLFGSGGWR